MNALSTGNFSSLTTIVHAYIVEQSEKIVYSLQPENDVSTLSRYACI
jgi:putative lipoic acid-binding regulatory protein